MSRKTPNSLIVKDAFVPSTPHTLAVPPPGGGNGTFPGSTTTPGTGSGSNTGTTSGNYTTAIPVVFFYDASTGHPTTWAWVFANQDGSTELGTSDVQDPVFTFPGPGHYLATLTTNVAVDPASHLVTVV